MAAEGPGSSMRENGSRENRACEIPFDPYHDANLQAEDIRPRMPAAMEGIHNCYRQRGFASRYAPNIITHRIWVVSVSGTRRLPPLTDLCHFTIPLD